MTKRREYEGQIYEFPDEATPDQVSEFILGKAKTKAFSNINVNKDEEKKQTNDDYNRSLFMPRMMNPTAALQQAGAETYRNPTARTALETELTSLIPAAKLAKFIPKSGKIAKYMADLGAQTLQNAGIGAGLSGLHGESPTQGGLTSGASTLALQPLLSATMGQHPLLKMAGAAGLGGLAGLGINELTGTNSYTPEVLGALGGAAIGARGKNAKQIAMMSALKNINPENIKPQLEAKERLGLSYLTPGEASGNPLLGKQEGRLGRTEETAQQWINKQEERFGTEKTAVKNLLKTIYPKTKEANQNIVNLYQDAYKAEPVPEEILDNFKQDSVFSKALSKVMKDPILNKDLKGIPQNSYAYLDQVKQSMDAMQKAALKKGNNNKARIIGESKNELLTFMDENNDSYKMAREEAQKKIVRNNIDKTLKKTRSEVGATTFYNSFLANDENYENLLNSLKNVPEAQQNLKDMKLLFKNISPPMGVKGATQLSKTRMLESRGGIKEDIWDAIRQATGGAHDREMIDLISSPDWNKHFETIKKIKDKNSRIESFAAILSRYLGQGLNQYMNTPQGETNGN